MENLTTDAPVYTSGPSVEACSPMPAGVLTPISKPARAGPAYTMNTAHGVPGSKQRPFRLLIVGGGPAGTSIITRAIRLGCLSEVCDCLGTAAGVCIVEKGPASRFGGGKLLDYEINSNTWGDKFATNVIVDKPNALPPELVTGTPLEALRGSTVAQSLIESGNRCVPLNLVGQFLAEVGAVVKSSVDIFSSSSIRCDTEVREIRQVLVGAESSADVLALNPETKKELWRVTIAPKRPVLLSSPGAYISGRSMDAEAAVVVGGLGDGTEELYAEAVVLASGGAQPISRSLHPAHSKKTLSSDFVCTKQGIEVLTDMLAKAKLPPGGAPAASKDRKIVIIGGSHSAFSAAWICLNKLDSLKFSFASGSICLIHRSPILVFYPTKRDAEVDGYTDIKHINRNGQIHPFGGIRGDAKQLYRHVKNGKESRVRMLMLKGGSEAPSAAKLMDEAAVIIWACGYTTNSIPLKDLQGEAIPLRFSYGQVEVDENARVLRDPLPSEDLPPLSVDLVQAVAIEVPTSPITATAIPAEAIDTVPAPTPMPPTSPPVGNFKSTSAKNSPRSPMKPGSENRGAITPTRAFTVTTPTPHVKINAVISSSGKLVSTKKTKPQIVKNLYATGLGYGLQATFDNGEPDGSSGRADGVAVYLKRSATLILSAVVGTKVFGDSATSWKERIAQGLAQAATAMKQKQALAVSSPIRPSTTNTGNARQGNASAKKVTLVVTQPCGSHKQSIFTGADNNRRNSFSGDSPQATYKHDSEKSTHPQSTFSNVKPVLAKPQETNSRQKSSSTSRTTVRKMSSRPMSTSQDAVNNVSGTVDVPIEPIAASIADAVKTAMEECAAAEASPVDPLIDLWKGSTQLTNTESIDNASVSQEDTAISISPAVGVREPTTAQASPILELPDIHRSVSDSTKSTQSSRENKPMFNGNRLKVPKQQANNKPSILHLPSAHKQRGSKSEMVAVKYAPTYVLAATSTDAASYRKSEAFGLGSSTGSTLHRVGPPFGVRAMISNAVVNPYCITSPEGRSAVRGSASAQSGKKPGKPGVTMKKGNQEQLEAKDGEDIQFHKPGTSPQLPSGSAIRGNPHVSTLVLTPHGVQAIAQPDGRLDGGVNTNSGVVLSPIRPERVQSSKHIVSNALGNLYNSAEICLSSDSTTQQLHSINLMSSSLPTNYRSAYDSIGGTLR